MGTELRLALVALTVSTAAVAQERGGDAPAHELMAWTTEVFLMSEVLELAPMHEDLPIQYDLLGWIGGAYHRVWLKADGVQSTRSLDGETELQVLYGRLIAPFWDAQVGARVDLGYGGPELRTRVRLAAGVQGVAPGEFELEPTLFVGFDGDVAASLTASYELLLTQRLVAQARLETEGGIQEVPDFDVGSGIHHLDLGLRVRYELWREVAPYLGVSWKRLLMRTADLARERGDPVSELSAVVGLRLWY